MLHVPKCYFFQSSLKMHIILTLNKYKKMVKETKQLKTKIEDLKKKLAEIEK